MHGMDPVALRGGREGLEPGDFHVDVQSQDGTVIA